MFTPRRGRRRLSVIGIVNAGEFLNVGMEFEYIGSVKVSRFLFVWIFGWFEIRANVFSKYFHHSRGLESRINKGCAG